MYFNKSFNVSGYILIHKLLIINKTQQTVCEKYNKFIMIFLNVKKVQLVR